MKFFLTSSTITLNLVKPFEEFVGRKSAGLRCAFIPDAGLRDPGDKSWIDEEMNYLIANLHWKVDKITLAGENYQSLSKLLNYDVIFANGGYSSYLAQVMRSCGFDKRLPEVLNAGIVYVGSSGGSMVLSKVQDAAYIYISDDESEPDALQIGGLGLWDFEFYPIHAHRWTEDLVDKIKAARNTDLEYYLVEDGQAISIENDNIKTYGDVIFLDKTN